MAENICTFTPHHSEYHTIHTINFVYETQVLPRTEPKAQAMYKVHYVCEGSGNLHFQNQTVSFSKGDVFFTFPDLPFSIESVENLSYMYVSFLGTRSDMILDKLKISRFNFLFHNCEEILPIWEKALSTNPDLSDLIAEGILLYTFTHLGNKILPKKINEVSKQNVAYLMKKYVDENYANTKLSLESIGKEISYSPKYLSSVFKKTYSIGVSGYINTVRIQHACALMREGVTSVNEISNRCGYTDAHYFCKMFKKTLGVAPSTYIKQL